MKIQKILITLFVLVGIVGTSTGISAEELVPGNKEEVIEIQTLEESDSALDATPSDIGEDGSTLAPSANDLDISQLQIEYEKALLIDQSNLLQSSKEALNLALDIASARLTSARLTSAETSQVDIDEAKDMLLTTVTSLVTQGDSSQLNTLYLEAKKIDRSKLTLESEARLSDAMMLAKGLLDSSEAAQKDLDAAQSSLSSVLSSLDYLPVEEVDSSLLKKEILKAEKIHVDNKEEVSKRRFLYALDQARQALLDENATQNDLDDLLIRLQNAQMNLVTDENYVTPPVLDDEKLSDEDIIGKPIVNKEPSKEVLPATGMGSLGLLFSNSMIFSGIALIFKDRKNK